MNMISGWGRRTRGLFADTKGPWGPSGDEDGEEGSAQGPWDGGSAPRVPRSRRSGNRSSFDEFLRRSRNRLSPGGQFPGHSAGSIILWAAIAIGCLWLVVTSTHSIGPEERGVVTRFGRYVYTLGPGVGLTLPSPIEQVQKVDVQQIRTISLGSPGGEDLMLTGDQNLIDIAYSVRWNIRDPELYLFELSQPEETIRQVAESSMRAVVSRVSLQDAIGDRRSEIEDEVAINMQRILDSYHAGVSIQGVAINQADPPQEVNDAFKDVSAAQQDAQRYINAASAYAQQLNQKAQGDATAFDKVYQQYKLAPEVTRRRMYYETMEQVLAKVNKTIVEPKGVVTYMPVQGGTASPQPPAASQGQGQ